MVCNYSSFVVTCPMKQELHVRSLIMGRNNKLLPNHKGPCQVIGRKQSIYIIEDLVRGKQIKTPSHLGRFLRLYADQSEVDALEPISEVYAVVNSTHPVYRIVKYYFEQVSVYEMTNGSND